MSTDSRTQNGRAEGTVALATVGAQRRLPLGFEYGCPGAAVHLGLRFRDKPATGIDGTTFPAAQWEQSPKFTLPNQPIQLAGVGAFASKNAYLPAGSPRSELAEVDRVRWKAALSTHMNVTADWFVIHDTGGGGMPANVGAIESNAGGVHMFLESQRVLLPHDFFGAFGGATRFERRHREFAGKFIHVELIYPATPAELEEYAKARRERRGARAIAVPNPPQPPGGYNVDALALVYIFASYRARKWLTVTCHLEVDRGIPGAHSDPRGFPSPRSTRRSSRSWAGPPRQCPPGARLASSTPASATT